MTSPPRMATSLVTQLATNGEEPSQIRQVTNYNGLSRYCGRTKSSIDVENKVLYGMPTKVVGMTIYMPDELCCMMITQEVDYLAFSL